MFKRKKSSNLNHQPAPRSIFAFNFLRAGDFIIFVEALEECYKFIYLPGGEAFYLSFNDFTKSIQTGTLSFVEQLPQEIYNESLEIANI